MSELPGASPLALVRRPWTPRRVFLTTLSVAAVASLFVLAYQLSDVLFLLFVSIVLATAMRPLVVRVARHHIPQRLGLLLLYGVLLLIVLGIGALLIPVVIDQGTSLVNRVPQYYQGIRADLQNSTISIVQQLSARLPPELDLSRFGNAPGGDSDNQSATLMQSIGLLGSIGGVLFGLVVVFLIAYFWTVDHDRIVAGALLLLHPDARQDAEDLWLTLEQKVGAYVRGQAVLMLVVGVTSLLAYFAIGLRSALLLGVLAGVLEALPVIGPLLTGVVAVLLTLAEAPDRIWWVIGATIAIQQLESIVLVPRIMGKAVGVNEIVTLLAVTAFGSLLGVLGAIMAIPMAAVIQVMVNQWVLRRDTRNVVIEGRGRASRTRYQIQELVGDLRSQIRSTSAEPDENDTVFEERLEILANRLDTLLTAR